MGGQCDQPAGKIGTVIDLPDFMKSRIGIDMKLDQRTILVWSDLSELEYV